MSVDFSVLDLSLQLRRYPLEQQSNLQAWDSADEYLLKHLIESQMAVSNIAIINDNFGALTCGVTRLYPEAKISVETDNKTSLLGTYENLDANILPRDPVEFISGSQPLPENLSLVLLKLPKNLVYFSHLLARLSQVLPKGTQVLIGAKAKSINKALLELIGKHLGQANASLAYKKSRIITCVTDGEERSLPTENQWHIPEYKLEVSNQSNVFAANKLDVGARIMLENMPTGEFNSIIDLGCGNGVLGLRAAQLFPNADVHFIDDSEMAVTSSKKNWQINQFEDAKGHFYWNDCLTDLPTTVKPDLILCNPPFHQGEAITDHIAWQMFLDARNRLSRGGVLHVVGNRHLGYHIKLKRLFGNCTTIASNGKFVILQAVK
ncbi:MAG: methyltransferase [Parashewanella sp.]